MYIYTHIYAYRNTYMYTYWRFILEHNVDIEYKLKNVSKPKMSHRIVLHVQQKKKG